MTPMADHPDVPKVLVDAVMASYGARALRHMLDGRLSESDLRTDLSDVVATVLAAVQPRRPDGPERRRVIHLDTLDVRSASTAH